MAASPISVPKFGRGQRVCFMGGAGVIQSYSPEAESWIYQVEMAMGREPEFGRIGQETTIVLAEFELKPFKAIGLVI